MGVTPRGSVEVVRGCALLDIEGDGRAFYSGYTDVWWDEQWAEPEDDEQRIRLICRAGHDWLSEITPKIGMSSSENEILRAMSGPPTNPEDVP